MEIIVHWDRNISILSGDDEKFVGFVPFYSFFFFFRWFEVSLGFVTFLKIYYVEGV